MPKSNLDYESPHKPISPDPLGVVACVIGAVATILPLLSLLELLTVPAGTTIRPMGQAAAMMVGAATGAFILLPLSLVLIAVSLWRRRPVRWAAWALLTAILATVAPWSVFVLLLKVRGFVLAD